MAQRGTVVNGVIVPDGSPPPEGTHVLFEPAEAVEYPHPLASYDREKEPAVLREPIAEMDAGVPGLTVEEVMGGPDSELRQMADHGRGCFVPRAVIIISRLAASDLVRIARSIGRSVSVQAAVRCHDTTAQVEPSPFSAAA